MSVSPLWFLGFLISQLSASISSYCCVAADSLVIKDWKLIVVVRDGSEWEAPESGLQAKVDIGTKEELHLKGGNGGVSVVGVLQHLLKPLHGGGTLCVCVCVCVCACAHMRVLANAFNAMEL